MKKHSIKKITLTRLLQVFVVSMLVIVSIVSISYKNFFQFIVENEVKSVSEIIKAGLTSHMKSGTMDKRAYFLNEISSVHEIESIEIVRGDAVIKEYGKSTMFEKKLDDNLRAILQKKETYIEWRDAQSMVKAIVPYIASSSGSFNCLQCHHVQDGTVLGAVSITMDTGIYQRYVLKSTYIIVGALLFFALIIIFSMFYVIERYVRKPLLNVIHEGETAYILHEDINSLNYESKEFEEVVRNINKFNRTVLDKEKELKYKNVELQLLNDEIELTLKETMLAVGQIEEIRSGETSKHAQRVAAISTMIAKEYGLDKEHINLIEIASPLHDIGKIGIADAILNKPDRLTQEEYKYMKSHSALGYDILKNSDRKILQTAAIIAYQHHEKYDGTGYPLGIKAEEIDISARIVAIVDVFDALLSKRVYKDIWTKEEVVTFFEEERGKHFDPKLVDIVLKNIDEYVKITTDL